MSSQKIILAFDTSNYTTSCAVCDLSGKILHNLKLPLPVAEGERGLRQSDASFHHVNRLPDLIDKVNIAGEVVAVGYSSSPPVIKSTSMSN